MTYFHSVGDSANFKNREKSGKKKKKIQRKLILIFKVFNDNAKIHFNLMWCTARDVSAPIGCVWKDVAVICLDVQVYY